MKIIVDAMGGDNAPECHRPGCAGGKPHPRAGDPSGGMDGGDPAGCGGLRRKTLPAGVEIKDAKEVVEIADDPAMAFKMKKDSSSPWD